jgi:hypothetical protein
MILMPGKGVFKRTDQPQKTDRRAKSFTASGGRNLHKSKLVKPLYKQMVPMQIKRLPANLHLGQIACEQIQ